MESQKHDYPVLVPIILVVNISGNHENKYNFSNYKARFNMPRDGGNMFYSFDLGPVHFVSGFCFYS